MSTEASTSTSIQAQSIESQIADSQLIDNLLAISKKQPKLVKSTESKVPGCEDVIVRSWKMNEFKYYDIPSPFPTLARGLFTTDATSDASSDIRHKIVVRGYDKFFNIGEVPWTTWEALRAHTAAPYVLSLKSNGCIIFIAAITESKLIVTSKHSVGSGDETVSHAMMGRKWLNKYLDGKGRTEADMASVLWKNKWTAVAELCDDSFEEHVLPYSPEKTGLHLHGLNVSAKPFHTLTHDVVDAFAEEWGFIRTASTTLSSIEEVQSFTDGVAKAGEWNGEAVEGFVVRTHVTKPPTETKKGQPAPANLSPYAPGSDFFFKIKFDEPYMMYRDWREVTKMLLTTRDKLGPHKMSAATLPKSKMRRAETQEYVQWVIGDIKRHPELFSEFGKGKGIIATRERFFQWKKAGGEIKVEAGVEGEGEVDAEGRKTVIVPVAIPGCGKTTVALALQKLFGWGHTQSDNVQTKKKAAPVFLKNVMHELETRDVVIADKNNHLKTHRSTLREAVSTLDPRPRLIALDWSSSVKSQPPARVHRICSDRIWGRGAGHQTLRPDTTSAPDEKRGKSNHEEVLWMFLNTMEELETGEVDAVVDMEVTEEGTPEEQLERAVNGLCPLLGIEAPEEARLEEALVFARDYEEKLAEKNAAAAALANEKKGGKEKGGKKAIAEAAGEGMTRKQLKKLTGKGVRYYGISAEVDLKAIVETGIAEAERRVAEGGEGSGKNKEVKARLERFWTHLVKEGRVSQRPHITLVHKNELGATDGSAERTKALWDRCVEAEDEILEGEVEALVWDERALAVVVGSVKVPSSADPSSATAAPTTTTGAEEDPDADLVKPRNDLSLHPPETPALRVLDALSGPRTNRLHITVGTKDESVRPVEAGITVLEWKDAGAPEGEWVKADGATKAWSVKFPRGTDGGVGSVRGAVKGMYA